MNDIKTVALKAAVPLTLPVCTGYVFLGITYGMLMVTSGFPTWLPIFTAAIIYTGSMEFLLVAILTSSFHPLSAFLTAIMVGARHLFYGLSMLGVYRGMGWKKPYLIYATSDETFSVNYTADIPPEVDRGWFFFWVSLLDQAYWVLGSALGALCGCLITIDLTGLDFVMTAMFFVIFLQQWTRDGENLRLIVSDHMPAIIGVLGSVFCLVIFGSDAFMIPAMVTILAGLLVYRRFQNDTKAKRPTDEEGKTAELCTEQGRGDNK